jgi:plastocyanin
MRSIVLASALVAVVGVASCGKKSSPTAPSSNAMVITVVGQNGAQSFNPNPASAGGKAVVFKNNDTVAHRVVLNDGTIDTGNIAPGATSAEFTMPTDGTNYHCSLHANMFGSVSAASGAPPPACTGIYCYE